MATIGEMITYYRKLNGYSQAELAKKLNISPAAIGNYELGYRTPHGEIEEALADIFNVSLDNLRGIDTERRQVPRVAPGTGELLDLYSRATPEQRKAVINLLRSFVNNT